jgi:hypothetical protein
MLICLDYIFFKCGEFMKINNIVELNHNEIVQISGGGKNDKDDKGYIVDRILINLMEFATNSPVFIVVCAIMGLFIAYNISDTIYHIGEHQANQANQASQAA